MGETERADSYTDVILGAGVLQIAHVETSRIADPHM